VGWGERWICWRESADVEHGVGGACPDISGHDPVPSPFAANDDLAAPDPPQPRFRFPRALSPPVPTRAILGRNHEEGPK